MPSEIKYTIANATGIPALLNLLNRKRLLVLTYHGIYDDPCMTGKLPDTFVHVDAMAKQLRELKKRYQFIYPDDLLQSLETGVELPEHSALLTFDDGYETFYRLAEPVIQALGIRSIVFVPTIIVEERQPFWFDFVWYFVQQANQKNTTWLFEKIGIPKEMRSSTNLTGQCLSTFKKMPPDHRTEIVEEIKQKASTIKHVEQDVINMFYPMTAEQILELSDRGTTFGGHTHTHTILSSMSDQVAEVEIKENKLRLERLVKRPVHFFAFPNGGKGDFTEQHKTILQHLEYKAAFSLTYERNSIHDDPLEIGRINVVPEDSQKSLVFKCSGISSLIKKTKNVLGIDQ